MRNLRLLLVAGLLVGFAAPASAQRHVAPRDHEPSPDTALVRVLTEATLRVVSPPESHLLTPERAYPWRITVTDSATPTGRRLRQALDRALGPRRVMPTDSVEAFVSWGELRVTGNELRAALAVGLAFRCPNGAWMGSSTGYRVRARRRFGRWRAPRVEPEIYADPAPCEVLPPPR